MHDDDRQHLADDGKPPELDKKKQVLPVGYIIDINGNRMAPRLERSGRL
jgi:hypothetical protein